MQPAVCLRRLCAHPLSLAIATTAVLPAAAQAAFVEDSTASLTTTNIYFNRDFREGTGQSKRDEWGQAFILDMRSGFTEGTVGFGLDASAMLGLKLDSGRGRTGTDLLPIHDDGRAADEFSRIGLTAKAKVSETELRYGSHVPELPLVKASTSRLLPQVFEGTMLQSGDLSENIDLHAARFNRVIDRAATGRQDLTLNNKNSRFRRNVTADHLNLAGLDWRLSPHFTARYYYSGLEDVYRQHYFGLLTKHSIGPGTLSSDLRLILSDDAGSAQGGKIDNRAINAMLTYALGSHKFGLGFQDMSGDTGFAYIDGSDPFLINFVQINDFANADQRSWQARYDFDFGRVGIPGLSFMTRYITSDDARVAGSNEHGGEWERDIELKYVVQSGPLKDLFVRLRNASFRSDFARDADENRLIVGYTLPIW